MTASGFPFLDYTGVAAFAHRGGDDAAPENTSAAFQHAVTLGYRYLETDAHVSADGVIFAFHDPDLSRMVGSGRTIAELTAPEIESLAIGDDGHRIPRLSELLDRFDAFWNLDPKTDEVVEPLAALIERSGALDRVCVGSFSDARVSRMRHLLGPRLCTSPGPRRLAEALGPSPRAPEHPVVSVPLAYGRLRLSRAIVSRFRRQGYRIHVWTVNDREDMHRMVDIGVDGIMTDRCELLRDVLRARSLWPGTG